MLTKVFWNSLLVAPAIVAAALVSNAAIATELPSSADSAESLAPVAAAVETPVVEAPVQVAVAPEAAPVAESTAPVQRAELPEVQAPVQVAQAAPAANVAPASDTDSLQQIIRYNREGRTNSLAQVTSVSQLSDVQPTDWAFQALQNLVERYGCIAGYPDGTYRGQRAMTRYEFAAGLNACLDRINELIASSQADAVTREDLATLQRLQEEFAAELATLRGRVDALEARTAELEANQFSTTTVLRGRTIFSVADIFGGDNNGVDSANNTVFQERVRLNFDTSFSGRDRLRARLQAGNFNDFNRVGAGATSAYVGGPADQTDFSYDSGGGNTFSLNRLEYYFPLGNKVTVYLEATGGGISDIVSTVSPFDDPEQGSLSYFGYNPIYDVGADAQNIGAGVTVNLTDKVQVAGGYLTASGNDPSVGNGLFNGSYTAFGQLTFTPGNLVLGLTYVNAYLNSSTGAGAPTSINAYGASANYNLNGKIQIGGWIMYNDYRIFAGSGNLGDGEQWSYAGTLGFSDLGRKGSLLGFIVGVPPRNAFFDPARGLGPSVVPEDAALHVEGFYRFPVNDNISVTPGVIWLMDPGNNNNNDDVVLGVLRTSFSF